MSSPKFISKSTTDEINNKADLREIFQHFHPELKKTGSSYEAKCPNCGSERLSLTESKGIVKCFSCGQGGHNAVGYLMKLRGMGYVEALQWLANRYNIDIAHDETYVHPDHLKNPVAPGTPPSAFRDAQLRASGIPDEAQQFKSIVGKDEVTLNRYDHGSIDYKGNITPGYDMLLHYLDLDGNPIMYKHERAKKEIPYIRVRYQIAVTDKDGKSVKYRTPPGGGNHLWLPEFIRTAFKEGRSLDTLVFIEGEKKADAMCLAGIPAVGIAGIHNFAKENEMPHEIERLIRACAVQSVVFFIDSDFDELGESVPKPADLRPRTFFKAAVKFKKYFDAYRHEGHDISIYLAHGIDRAHKGMDDLLVALRDGSNADKLPDLSDDLKTAMHSHESAGKHIKAYDITYQHNLQLEQIWHLHSVAAFNKHHAERLKQLPEFTVQGIKYQWNKTSNSFEIAQKLLPDERYWKTITNSRTGRTDMEFYYTGINEFLGRRGYGQLEVSDGRYRLIHSESNIVTAVDPQKITRYVYDFTKSIEEPDVLEMLLKGGRQYLGPDRLSSLQYITPDFITPRRDRQYFCFKDKYWEITAKEIKEHTYKSLPGAVWKDDIIDFSPTYIPDFFTVKLPQVDGGPIDIQSEIEDSDIFQYFKATSDILWRTASDRSTEAKTKRIETLNAALTDKLIATGYILSNYMDPAVLKAIICMDAVESENGRSEGGTGKSIWATMFEHVVPTRTISAKSPRLTEDAHLYEGVDERTRVIVFDDCRRNLDFESFLSDITRGITVNPKGLSRYFIGPRRMIFTTNHSIRGEDRSYVRRQYIIPFSDFFNSDRTPYDVFKRALFNEWDHTQFNYFYNLMAKCLQLYMQHGLVSFAPSADIQRRKLRDEIGETVLDFLETRFYHGSEYINSRHDIMECIKYYLIDNPSQRNFASKGYMRKKLSLYCRYAGFQFNPGQKGERYRNGSSNIEWFVIADDKWTPGVDKLNMGITFGSQDEESK